MKALRELPLEYKEIFSIDLQKDKKQTLIVNGLAVAVYILMIVPVNFFIPINSLFTFEKSISEMVIRNVVLVVGMIAYIILHEAVHGVAMKICGTKKCKFGFTGLYAFACSDDYYNKKAYTFIALAPVVFWGVVLAVLNIVLPTEWFWVVYIIQVANVSGAMGDFYVTYKFSDMPDDILINDSGVGMKVYSAE